MILAMTDIALAEENARLKARLAETEAALEDAVEAQRRLESIVGELRREKFGPGRKSSTPSSSTCRSKMSRLRRASSRRLRRGTARAEGQQPCRTQPEKS
ncbi:hypothetical protein AKL17_4447 [Frigidibacter mobilis]|uniref:Uncharacterized protein n=1 Tax=Frigidibacter mobilis TaxID=1335048 RepID=A0A161H133_9RHOB|nr:hypothetical protein AKL17_4447 [Frigidibacter mobilis]